MFKLFVLAIFVVSVALCYEEDLQEFIVPEEDLLVPAGDLPPRALVRFRRQLFGGRTSLPSGGFNQHLGFRGSVFSSPTKDLSAWGSLSQSGAPTGGFRAPVSMGPITYKGGADFTTSSGSGLSGSFIHTDKLGGAGTFGGNLNLLHNKNHNLNAFASHTQNFDGKFNRVGSGSTTLGTKYQNAGGANVFLSGTRTPGLPNSYSYSAETPLFNGNAAMGFSGKTIEKLGSEATLSGKVKLTDNLEAFGSHTKGFDTKLNVLGSSTTLGAGYAHPSGVEVKASGTRTSGMPDSGTVAASVPVFSSGDGKTKVQVDAQSNFGGGQKPNHQVGLTLTSDLG